MPFNLPLTNALRQAGWRVAIYDAEGAEEPHVTIYRRGKSWRVSLRDGEFLDTKSRWRQIHKDVRKAIEGNMETLQNEWDEIHGDINPISSEEEE